VNVIRDAAGIREAADEWDAVAAAARLPLMSSAQVAAWWTHLAPEDSELRVILVREAASLIGVAPFYERRSGAMLRTYALPGAEIGAGISPISLPGRQWEVAGAISRALARSTSPPDVIDLRRAPLGSPWPAMLRASWPAPVLPRISHHNVEIVPGIQLAKRSFDEWLQGRSPNLRSQVRRAMRSFDRDGGTVRLATSETVGQDMAAMMSLHLRRMAGRGASSFEPVADRLVSAIAEVGASEATGAHLRLWVLEMEGAVVSVEWFSARGGHVSYVNGGWHPDFRRYSPALLGIVYAIKDACERGEEYMDLGPGAHEYKLRLSDCTDAVARTTLLVANRRIASTLAQTAPGLLYDSIRDTAKRVLPPERLDALRALRGKASAGGTKPGRAMPSQSRRPAPSRGKSARER